MTDSKLDAGFAWLTSEQEFAASLGLPNDVITCPPELREPRGVDTEPPNPGWGRAFGDSLTFRESLLVAKAAGYQLRGLFEASGLALRSSLRLVLGDAVEATPVTLTPVLSGTGLLRLDEGVAAFAPLVPFATRADGFAALVAADGGSQLVVVPTPGTSVGVPGTMYDDGTADVTFRPEAVASASLVIDLEDAEAERVVAGLRLHRAAVAVGGARAAIALARNYTIHRQAFGHSIAAFQTVRHALSNVHADVEGAELLLQAASSELIDGGTDATLLAREAAAFAAVTYRLTSDQCLHLHGGRGFLKSSAIEAYFRHAKQHELRDGGPYVDHFALSEQFSRSEGYVPANLFASPNS